MTSSSLPGRVEPARGLLPRIEEALLALLLGAMILLASLQIFLRNFFDEGLVWIDPLLRLLVLWVGLMGALAASRGNRHITIDVFPRLLPPRPRAAVAVLVHGFTAGVCGLLAWHSWRFVQDEREFGGEAFLGVPTWVLEVVLPFAFAMIAIRYGLNLLREGGVALGLSEPEPGEGAA